MADIIMSKHNETYKQIQETVDAHHDTMPPEDIEATVAYLKEFKLHLAAGEDGTLLKELRDLSRHGISIQTSFDNIEKVLRDLAHKQDSIAKLHTTWKEHQQTYTDLLWESRTAAGSARAAAQEFLEEQIPMLLNDNIPLADKQAEIGAYITKLEEDEQKSSSYSQGFANLKKSIDTFKEDWETIKAHLSLEGDALQDGIRMLDSQIQDLEKELSYLNKLVIASATKVGILVGATGITAVLGCFIPAFFTATLCLVIPTILASHDLIDDCTKRNEARSQLENLRAQRKEKIEALDIIHQVGEGLDEVGDDFENICVKLMTFSQIWSAIRTDVQNIRGKLEYGKTTKLSSGFRNRIEKIKTLYTALERALYHYEVIVNEKQINEEE